MPAHDLHALAQIKRVELRRQRASLAEAASRGGDRRARIRNDELFSRRALRRDRLCSRPNARARPPRPDQIKRVERARRASLAEAYAALERRAPAVDAVATGLAALLGSLSRGSTPPAHRFTSWVICARHPAVAVVVCRFRPLVSRG
ncbi:MAG: hypothetical protein R3A52_24935 [Polyangiales bacterium]